MRAEGTEYPRTHFRFEALVGDLRHNGAPWAILAGETVVVDRLQAVEVIRHQPK